MGHKMKEGTPHKFVDPKKKFVVHPDMGAALSQYDGTDAALKNCFLNRDEAVNNGQAYWETDHDFEMSETAEERSANPEWCNNDY